MTFIRNVGRAVKTLFEKKPCYRCAGEASVEYAGHHYCLICRDVVHMVLPSVRHDPPPGFPGASGHLEFPKKEKARG